jgi:hypothetical protein
VKILALASLLLLTVGVGAAAAQPVPASVEQQIAKRAGIESYTPARMMTGWHYVRWQYVPGELRVWFTNRSNWQVEFVVTPRLTASCDAGKQKTFQLDGNKVYWSQTTNPMVDRYQQQAWRCVKSPSGRWMRIAVQSGVPPTKLADVGLGIVAAAGRLIKPTG